MYKVNTTAVTCETIIHYIKEMEDHFLNSDIDSFMQVYLSLEPEMEFLKEINPSEEIENTQIILLACYKMMICIFMAHSIECLIASVIGCEDEKKMHKKYEDNMRSVMMEAFIICDLNKETSELNKKIFTECFNELMRVKQ